MNTTVEARPAQPLALSALYRKGWEYAAGALVRGERPPATAAHADAYSLGAAGAVVAFDNMLADVMTRGDLPGLKLKHDARFAELAAA